MVEYKSRIEVVDDPETHQTQLDMEGRASDLMLLWAYVGACLHRDAEIPLLMMIAGLSAAIDYIKKNGSGDGVFTQIVLPQELQDLLGDPPRIRRCEHGKFAYAC